MNMSVNNFEKTSTTKQRFTNEVKTERKASHKHMQQSRRSARHNKTFTQSL